MAIAKKVSKAAPPVRKTALVKPPLKAPGKARAKLPVAPEVRTMPAAAAKAEPANGPKADKPRKPKLVRDSFTIPKAEYVVLQQLKDRAARSGAPAKKSEVLRAGLKALAAMDDAAFITALGAVPALKTGRPANS
jgi:hypothetical protein